MLNDATLLGNRINENIRLYSSDYYRPSQLLNLSYAQNVFSLIHFNINNITSYQKFDNICDILWRFAYKFIAVTETCLNGNNCQVYQIPDYVSFHKPRKAIRKENSGGISCFVLAEFKPIIYEIPKNLLPNEQVAEFLCIHCRSTKYLVLVIYRPPQGSSSLFVQSVTNILSFLATRRSPIIITGDLNINLLNYQTCSVTRHLVETLFIQFETCDY